MIIITCKILLSTKNYHQRLSTMINYIISTTKYHQPSNQLTSGPAGLFNVQPKPLKRAQRLLSNQVRCGKAWDVNGLRIPWLLWLGLPYERWALFRGNTVFHTVTPQGHPLYAVPNQASAGGIFWEQALALKAGWGRAATWRQIRSRQRSLGSLGISKEIFQKHMTHTYIYSL